MSPKDSANPSSKPDYVPEQLLQIVERYGSESSPHRLFTHSSVAWGSLNEPEGHMSADFVDGALSSKGPYIYDLASLTKMLSTAALAAKTFGENIGGENIGEENIGALSDHDSKGFLANVFKSELLNLSIRQLLAHKTGLPAWSNIWIQSTDWLDASSTSTISRVRAQEKIAFALNYASLSQTKTPTRCYSDLGFLLLGTVLELTNGSSLSEQFDSLLLDIGCSHLKGRLQYGPILSRRHREDSNAFSTDFSTGTVSFVPSSYCNLRKRNLVGEVHDENCASLGGVSGHAGLFGDAESIGIFLSKLFGHEYGKTMLKWQQQPGVRHEEPVGFQYMAPAFSGEFGSGKAIGHLGFVGTGIWLDFSCDQPRYCVQLTNRVALQRIPHPSMRSFRASVCDSLAK